MGDPPTLGALGFRGGPAVLEVLGTAWVHIDVEELGAKEASNLSHVPLLCHSALQIRSIIVEFLHMICLSKLVFNKLLQQHPK